MYESPTYLTMGELKSQLTQSIDALVIKACRTVAPMVDEEELRKALIYDRQQYEKGFEDGKKSTLEELPSTQPDIICCKDCIHSDIYPKGADNDMPLKCLGIRYGGVMPDWYCEHAERRA